MVVRPYQISQGLLQTVAYPQCEVPCLLNQKPKRLHVTEQLQDKMAEPPPIPKSVTLGVGMQFPLWGW